jgi:biotin operon repressor
MGTGAIQSQYGISRVQVFKLIESGQWPKPVGETGNGRLWTRTQVEKAVAKLEATGRLVTLQNGRKLMVPTRLTK